MPTLVHLWGRTAESSVVRRLCFFATWVLVKNIVSSLLSLSSGVHDKSAIISEPTKPTADVAG